MQICCFHSPFWSSRQSSARESMIQSFIVLLHGWLSLQVLVSQKVKQNKASQDSRAALLELCRLQPSRRDCQLHPTDRLRANRENTPTFQERPETYTLQPPAGVSVKHGVKLLNLLQMEFLYKCVFNIFMCLQHEWVKYYNTTGIFFCLIIPIWTCQKIESDHFINLKTYIKLP